MIMLNKKNSLSLSFIILYVPGIICHEKLSAFVVILVSSIAIVSIALWLCYSMYIMFYYLLTHSFVEPYLHV